ncbi:putative fungistatic metabolite [Cercospora beticola]|uniref:Putative fungistatic metabolite n=1 Tax=Cercospora beticola TaxID=122368 RepID=A0A2G5GQ82_CERBT|nr:putative fungistatic metabolite [Cercospora beticola]PIA82429.1 putative fungistatic metabolite [Cercospora beticola]WPB03930.1 hypothetical protein RHO25_008574 [Cercospora beticola]
MRAERLAFLALGLRRCLAQTWTYQGCYLDDPAKRTLKFFTNTDNNDQTIESCTGTCASLGYGWAGVEYGHECFCDKQLNSATQAPESDCSMRCVGNSSQTCGNGNRLSVYTTGSTYTAPTTNPGPAGWSSLGCYTDSVGSRSLGSQQFIDAGANAMTVAACTQACKSAGYPVAGLEYANQCFCDTKLQNGATQADDGCDMACAGNSTELCGGSNRLNVYEVTGGPTTEPSPPAIPSGWTSLGCYTDSAGARSLPVGMGVPGDYNNMTIEGCLTACGNEGFSYAGIEYSRECYCANSVHNGGSCASDQSTCNMKCTGNRGQTCGGPDRLNVYYAGSDSSVRACSAGGGTSSSTTSSATSRSTSTSVLASSATSVSTSSSSASSSGVSSATTTTRSTTVPSSSSTTTSFALATTSSTVTTTTRTTTTSSSTSTTTTPASTVCPEFWKAVVSDLASGMRDAGLCNNISRAAIRYAFHDSATFSNKLPFYPPAAGGADGSLLLSTAEINRIDSEGLHDYHNFITAKFSTYKAAGYQISAADLIQVAGSVGVLACPGGRVGRMLVGRTDTTTAAPDGLLPQAFGPGSDHDTLFQLFVDKGFTARDLAALLGAHSTSIANFQQRFGMPANTAQDTTPGEWDVLYYNQTYFPVSGMGRFDSDINLARNENRTAVGFQFRSFVGRPAQWGASFASAWQALTLLGVPQSVRNNMQDCTVVVSGAFS